MIRAAALLACAQGEDGGIPADAAELAAAVEMLHLATLVHDDVIDDADLRRGIPTLQRMYGRRTAVICGDYLLAASLRLAAQVGDRERYLDLRLPDYVGRICLGELGQHLNNGNLELTAYRYLKIIGGKTAALFEAAFYAGALFFTEEERLIRRYARLGRQIGMIFQLTDDCIDFESDEATAKKPVRSDYEQGVVTLPLIRAFEQDPAFLERARRGKLARAEVDERVRASRRAGRRSPAFQTLLRPRGQAARGARRSRGKAAAAHGDSGQGILRPQATAGGEVRPMTIKGGSI